MMLGIGQRQRAAPRAAEYQPAFYVQMLAQQLHVRDQMRRGVVFQFAQRRGAPGATLIENNNAVVLRVEKTPVRGRRTRAGAAMQKHHRLAIGVARHFPIHLMQTVERQDAGIERLDIGIQLGAQGGGVIGHGVFLTR